MNSYKINTSFKFETEDYGGIKKSPFGNQYSSKFLIYSILCQINFVLIAVNKFVLDETTTKLRISYILYYYLMEILPDINKELRQSFKMNDKFFSDEFRNAMAHYKIGVALKAEDVVLEDPMFGLTQKIFSTDYYTVKTNIVSELEQLKHQIKDYLIL